MPNEVVNAHGEEVVEKSEAAEAADSTSETVDTENEGVASTDPAPADTSTEKAVAEEGAVEEAPTERKPSEEVLEATTLMAQAASRGPEEAQAAADKLNREVLIQTIAFQLPETWLSSDVHARIAEMPTASLALVLSWLALNWWEGYEIGRRDTITALKTAAAKGLGSEKDKAVIAEVEKQIDADRKENMVT